MLRPLIRTITTAVLALSGGSRRRGQAGTAAPEPTGQPPGARGGGAPAGHRSDQQPPTGHRTDQQPPDDDRENVYPLW